MKTFKSVAALRAAKLTAGQLVRTLGYYEGSSDGAAEYLIVASATGTDDGGSYHNLVDTQAKITRWTASPLHFGAKLDGVTDDTQAVSNWILSGLELFGVDRTANLSTWSEITTTAPVTIRGSGLVIKGTNTSDFMRLDNDLSISGVKFDTWRYVFSKEAANNTDVSVAADSCKFTNIDYYSFFLRNNLVNSTFTNNLFTNNSTGAILLGDNTPSIQQSIRDIEVSGNICKDIANTGGGNCHFLLALADSIIVTDNIVEGISANTGEAWGVYLKAVKATVSGNIIKDITSTSSNSFAINLKGEPEVGGDGTAEGRQIVCTGNTLVNSAVGDSGININMGHAVVDSNYAEGFTIGIQSSGTKSDNLKITNNLIKGLGAGVTSSYGIRTTSESNNYIIKGNVISDVYLGIRYDTNTAMSNIKIEDNAVRDFGLYSIFVAPSAGTLSNISISNNLAEGGQRFCSVNRTDKLNIVGNCWDNLTALPYQFITFESSSTNSNVYISNNTPIKVQTLDATATNVSLLSMPQNQTALTTVDVVANSSAGRAAYSRNVCTYRISGVAVLQGAAQSSFPDTESDVGWDVLAGVNSNATQIRVVGAAATTIDWSVALTYNSVGA